MTALSAKDLASIRSQVQDFFVDAVILSTVSYSKDEFGKKTQVKTQVAVVKGLLDSPSGDESIIRQAMVTTGTDLTKTATLLLPYGTPITTDMIATSNGLDFNVTAVSFDTLTGYTEATLKRREVM